MNLLEKLKTEVEQKNYTREEAIRYLYLFTAKNYSFDYHFNRAVATGDRKELRSLADRKHDIKNTSFEPVVCSGFCESILGPLLEEIVHCRVGYMGSGIGHRYLTVKFFGEDVILDPTERDFTRVKMHMSTDGFTLEPYNMSYNFISKLKSVDKTLGYIKEEYSDTKLYKDCSSNIEIMEHVKTLFDKYKFKHFIDAKQAINEIFELITTYHLGVNVPHGTLYDYKNRPIGLYNCDGIFYKLYKEEYYKLKPISLSEAYQIIERYDSADKEILLETNTKSLKLG